MKLHLGCGGCYLQGYVNIDFPPEKHTIQKKGIADLYKDILKLRYARNSVDEIRLHHVFEHFTRDQACALIAAWHSWLKVNGRLHIEVPDHFSMVLQTINPLMNENTKMIALRHIFGSHEAGWGHHYEGWDKKTLTKLLKIYGFEVIKESITKWKTTYNLTLIANKTNRRINQKDAYQITKKYLTNYLVDNSPSEQKLLNVWMQNYNKVIHDTWCKE